MSEAAEAPERSLSLDEAVALLDRREEARAAGGTGELDFDGAARAFEEDDVRDEDPDGETEDETDPEAPGEAGRLEPPRYWSQDAKARFVAKPLFWPDKHALAVEWFSVPAREREPRRFGARGGLQPTLVQSKALFVSALSEQHQAEVFGDERVPSCRHQVPIGDLSGPKIAGHRQQRSPVVSRVREVRKTHWTCLPQGAPLESTDRRRPDFDAPPTG